MSIAHPSDFTPIPQVLLTMMRQGFVTRSLKMLGTILGGGGAPIVSSGDPGFGIGGQYLDGPTFVSSVVTANRRDITSDSALTPAKPTGVNNKGVLLNRRSNLIAFVDDTKIGGANKEKISAELGLQLGEMVADDYCSILVATLIGIVEGMTASVHSASVWVASGSKINLSADLIDQGRYKMGDRMDQITHMLCRAGSNRDLRSEAVGRSYDAVGGLTLQGADNLNQHGLIKAIRDDASLAVTDAGFDKAITLLMGAGVLEAGFVSPVEVETIRIISNETKQTNWRADWDLYVRCPKMAYNSGAGGANPTVAALGTSSNWTDNTTSHKELPLVELIHNSSDLS